VDRNRLEVVATGGRYILKPEPARFAGIPQNEHLTMRLASLVGLETPPFGLLWLKDGAVACLIRRFDRLDDGGKLRVEDFCQLAGQHVADKYRGSAELCVRILRQYASEPLVEIRKLYKLLLFGWWTANGDQHLKNFSLLIGRDGLQRLAPVYDQVCTRVVNDDRSLALPVGGKSQHLTRKTWLDFAAYCGLPPRAAERLLAEQADALEPARAMVRRSFLPEEIKEQYEQVVQDNTAVLTG
jgi:serine/threonine-protein kinase HipA